MGMGAIRNVISKGAPELIGGRAFTPEDPEEIVPYVGTIELQYHYDKYLGYAILTDREFHYGGPPLQDFWLGRTVKGEVGDVRKGLKNNNLGDFALTSSGIAARATIFDNWHDRFGQSRSTGLYYSEDIDRHNPNSGKELLARAIFNIINPSTATDSPSFLEIEVDSMRRRSAALKKFGLTAEGFIAKNSK